MSISEEKKKIVIDNYFKEQCTVDTSIREAFTKGFECGLIKAQGKHIAKWDYSEHDGHFRCSKCGSRAPYDTNKETGEECDKTYPFCPYCGADMRITSWYGW